MHAPRFCRMFTRGKESPGRASGKLLQNACCVRSAPLTIIGRRLQGMPHFGGTQLNSPLAALMAFFHDRAKGRVGAAGAALSPSPASSWTSRSETPSLCRQFGIESVPQGLDFLSQAAKTFERNADVAENRRAQAVTLILKGLGALGQIDEHLTLVVGIASAFEKPGGLHTLQHWGQRTALDGQPLAEVADGLVVLLPQNGQQEELGIGDAQLVQQGLVGALDGEPSRVDRIAGLYFELFSH